MSTITKPNRLAREVGLHALALLITALVLCKVFDLGRADLRYPIAMNYKGGDGTYYAAQVKILLETGWVYHHPDLGAPFGLDLYDFAHFDALHLLIMKLLGYAFHNWAVVLNVYFLLGYGLTTVTALLLFRHLRIAPAVAVALAILFAFQPYHLYRGQGHLMLSGYYLLPLQLFAMGWLLSPHGLADGEGVSLWRSWRCRVACLVAFVAIFAGHYYSAFALMAYATAAVYTGLRLGTWRPVAHAGLLAGVVAFGFTLNLLPNAVYWAREGSNRMVSAKNPAGSEVYAFRLAPAVFPIKYHRLRPLRKIREHYNAATPTPAHELRPIGLVASAGLIGLLACGIFWRGGNGLLGGIGVVTVALVLFCTFSGLGTVFAFLVSPQLHAMARVSILLALLGLIAVGLVATAGLERLGRPGLGAALVAVAGVLGLLDIWPAVPPYDRREMATQCLADERFARAIQQAVPPGTWVHQMPTARFPFESYNQFGPFLFTTGLRWTYPVMINRRGMMWCEELERLPADAMLERMVLCGVGGVILEPEPSSPGTKELRLLLDRLGVPRIEAESGQCFFDLRAVAEGVHGRYSAEVLELKRLEASPPVLPCWGHEFGMPKRSAKDGWRDYRWCLSPVGHLDVVNFHPVPIRVRVEMDLRSAFGDGAFEVTSRPLLGDRPLSVAGDGPVAFEADVPPGRHRLRVTCRALRPVEPGHGKQLWFRIEGLRLGLAGRTASVVRR